MIRRGSVAAVGAALLAAAGLIGGSRCFRGSPPLEPASSILRRGNGAEPESLDPHAARSESSLTILRDLDEGLVAVGPDGAPTWAAADRVEVSQDGLTYRFHLRHGARWSNGDALVAEDFTFAWRRLVDPRSASPYADMLECVRNAARITLGLAAPESLGARAEGDDFITVRLEHPTSYLLSVLAHPATFPVNRGSLAAHGAAFAKPGVLVSNGAFVLERWDFGSHLSARRNANYWNDAATRFSRVDYYSFADSASELRAFRAGQIDLTAAIPPAQLGWVRERLGSSLHLTPQLAVYYLGLNVAKPPFAGAQPLRQALSLVIDRERLVQWVTAGGETPAYTFVPPQLSNYTPPLPEYAAWPMTRRVVRARELLRALNLKSPPLIELRFNAGELHERIAVAVAEMWKESLGVVTVLRAEDFKVLLDDITRGDAAAFRASWVADYGDPYSFLQVLKSNAGVNSPHYRSAGYDRLLEQAAAEADSARRAALLESAEALMLADQPVIPLYFYVAKHLVNPRVEGFRNNALNIVYSKNLSKSSRTVD